MPQEQQSPNPQTAASEQQLQIEHDNQDAQQSAEEKLFGESQTVPAGTETETESPAGDKGTAEGAAEGTETTAPATGLSREDIVEILKSAGLGEVQPAPAAAAPEPELTQEQFEKAFNVFRPSEDLVKRLTDESPAVRIKAITELRDALIKQALTMTEHRINQHLSNLRSQTIEPLQSYVSERQAREFHDEFFEKYPDLAPYELIVDAVASKLQEKGFTAPNREAVMKRFADDAKAAVSALLAKGGKPAQAGGNGGTAAAKPQRRMSTLSGGGQGGASKPGTAGTGEDKYKDLPKNVAAGLAALD